ncbi:MAG: GSU2403 family nucleotidyltransferase fold protein [Coriobacteriia bacterium]|nr:GSU2403 family nucleotidyltransferase fold protein [Coriobacteriia bacterium]
MSGLDPVLRRGLSAIEPYLDEVVLAGGWVPHIYELLYDATASGRSPRTRDIDLAVRRTVPLKGRSIDELLTAAEFECRFHSLDTPPVTKYVATTTEGEVEIEFITDAPGAAEGAVQVQSDLTAQGLHYVGIMLEDPWAVDLGALTGEAADHTVLVPRPGAFVFHKALAFRDRRDRLKREKDLYYVFFVLDAFPAWREMIAAEFTRFAAVQTAWFKKAHRNLSSLFDSPDSAGVAALVNQRPQTAFPGMADEQFRQYAFSVMSDLVSMMSAASQDSLEC